MVERLRLMADYRSWPIWRDGGENVDPATLSLSANLRERLAAWAARFDATLDEDDPLASGFPDAAASQRFDADGIQLCRALRDELGDAYEVAFFSPARRRLLEAPRGPHDPPRA